MKKGFFIFAASALIGITILFQYLFYETKPVVVNSWADSRQVMTVMNDKAWEIDFSKEMDPLTLTPENIYILDGQGEKVPVTMRVQSNQKGVVLAPPKEGFKINSKPYTLKITSDVESKEGSPLRSSQRIFFQVSAGLPSVKSKDQLQAYFKKIIKQQKEERRTLFKSDSAESKSSDAAENSAASEAETSNDYSKTNVQVQGIDEGDIIKTDGKYIYQAIDRRLKITQAMPAEEIKAISEIKYETFNPYQLYVDDDKLLVIGNEYVNEPQPNGKNIETIMPLHETTKAILYDISNPNKPDVLKTIELEGHYVTSRKAGNIVYLISNHYPDYWRMEEEKEADLRPRIFDSASSKEMSFIPYDKIHLIPQGQEPNYTIITSFNISKPAEKSEILSYLVSGSDLYMNKDHLYLAVGKYITVQKSYFKEETEVYKFSLKDTRVEFLRSGTVPGRVLNQFSMDEHKGHFRIVTTVGETRNERNPSGNNLFILDAEMGRTGSVENLARGERVYSVRFMGDKAYVVTFKETDPLFVLDVEDAANPKVLGELKIPGFSNYLHPYDENHLIGFGQNTKLVKDQGSSTPRVVTDGVKISLFDVSNPLEPKEKFTEVIGGTGTHSPLENDHKALLFSKEKNIFAFPISIFEEKKGSQHEQLFKFQGALVYTIDSEQGILLQKEISHSSSTGQYGSWENEIQRLLYIQDYLFAVSANEVTAEKITWK